MQLFPRFPKKTGNRVYKRHQLCAQKAENGPGLFPSEGKTKREKEFRTTTEPSWAVPPSFLPWSSDGGSRRVGRHVGQIIGVQRGGGVGGTPIGVHPLLEVVVEAVVHGDGYGRRRKVGHEGRRVRVGGGARMMAGMLESVEAAVRLLLLLLLLLRCGRHDVRGEAGRGVMGGLLRVVGVLVVRMARRRGHRRRHRGGRTRHQRLVGMVREQLAWRLRRACVRRERRRRERRPGQAGLRWLQRRELGRFGLRLGPSRGRLLALQVEGRGARGQNPRQLVRPRRCRHRRVQKRVGLRVSLWAKRGELRSAWDEMPIAARDVRLTPSVMEPPS